MVDILSSTIIQEHVIGTDCIWHLIFYSLVEKYDLYFIHISTDGHLRHHYWRKETSIFIETNVYLCLLLYYIYDQKPALSALLTVSIKVVFGFLKLQYSKFTVKLICSKDTRLLFLKELTIRAKIIYKIPYSNHTIFLWHWFRI